MAETPERKQRPGRIKKNYEFHYVYRRGENAASREMVLTAVKNRTKNVRVGYSVSAKIGKSVVRNRAKRLMREAVKSKFDKMQTGYTYIVAARRGIVGATYENVERSFLYMLKKLGRLSEEKRLNEDNLD